MTPQQVEDREQLAKSIHAATHKLPVHQFTSVAVVATSKALTESAVELRKLLGDASPEDIGAVYGIVKGYRQDPDRGGGGMGGRPGQ